MAFCMVELHLWSSKSSLQVQDTDIGTYQYYDKEQDQLSERLYHAEKQRFAEARGYLWTPRNRRPDKLRDSLKELEELLENHTCVRTRWKSKHCCQLMLSNGVLVTLTLKGPQLERVCVDRTLLGRLPAATVSDAVLSDRLMLLSFLEQSQVCVVHVNKKSQGSPDAGRKVEKLSPSEIKVLCVELRGGGVARRLARRVGLNRQQDVAVCWWPLANPSEELWPWAPSHTHTHKSNLVLLSCSPTEGLKVLSSIRTEGDPLDCCFSLLQPYQLLSVEMPAGPSPEARGPDEACWVESCVYECARGRLQRLSATRVPLTSRPLACSRHPAETALLLGLADSSLVLYDQRRGVSLLAPSPVPPSLLAWHPGGAAVVVGGGQGELACFDVGLAPLHVALVAEEAAPADTLRLPQHLRCSGGLEGLRWGAGGAGGPEGAEVLMLAFQGGPLAALRFRLGALSGGRLGPSQLLQQRLRCRQVDQALGILGAMEWSTMGNECYRGLCSVADHLLRREMNAETEAQLEATLGIFYAPPRPLSDTLVLEYREPISKYARRFFHHLLRHQRFEKAFLLAVDIGARDLFMDLHYVSRDKGEMVLADVAMRKANEIHAEALALGTDDPPPPLRLGNGERASTLGDRRGDRPSDGQAEGNVGTRGPSSQSVPTWRGSGRSSHGRLQGQPLTPSADSVWPWRHTEIHLVDSNEEAEDPGSLKVIHFGLV